MADWLLGIHGYSSTRDDIQRTSNVLMHEAALFWYFHSQAFTKDSSLFLSEDCNGFPPCI